MSIASEVMQLFPTAHKCSQGEADNHWSIVVGKTLVIVSFLTIGKTTIMQLSTDSGEFEPKEFKGKLGTMAKGLRDFIEEVYTDHLFSEGKNARQVLVAINEGHWQK